MWVPMRLNGLSEGHRILEDHGDLGSPEVLHLRLLHRRHVAAGKRHRPADVESRALLEQSHDGAPENRLAGTGFTHDAESFAGGDVDRDTVDCSQLATGSGEYGSDVVRLQQRNAVLS